MEFDDVLIQEIKADPYKRTVTLLLQVVDQLHVNDPIAHEEGWNEDEHDLLLQTCAFVSELMSEGIISLSLSVPRVGDSLTEDCGEMLGFVYAVEKHCTARSSTQRFNGLRTRFRTAIGDSFSYRFTDGDLQRVQELVNEIRDQIAATDKLEDEHRRRLLMRLEKLQSELHKKMSDLDRFWGMIGDAGVVLAKLGKDAKPIVDRIRELTGIVWSTQARAEELPSGTLPPLLGNSPENEEDAE